MAVATVVETGCSQLLEQIRLVVVEAVRALILVDFPKVLDKPVVMELSS